MLNTLKQIFLGTADATVDDVICGQTAYAALLVRIARADGDHSDHETDVIKSHLRTQFELDDPATETLFAAATTAEAKDRDTVHYTKQIKDLIPIDDRVDLIEALWSVALADGDRADEENSEMRLIVSLLGINDRTSALARQRAAG